MISFIKFILVVSLIMDVLFVCPAPLSATESVEEKLQAVLSKLYTSKKYDDAIEICHRYLESKEDRLPDGGLALLFGKILLKSNKPDDWTLAGKALRWSYVTDERLREEGLYYFAESYERSKYLDEAVFGFERFLMEYPRSVYADSARLKAAEAMRKTGRFEGADETFRRLLNVPGYHERALIGLMKNSVAMGRLSDAAPYLDQAAQLGAQLIQEDDESLVAAARTELSRSRFEEAKYYVDSLEKYYPKSASLHRGYLVLADVMLAQKRTSEAEQYYELAVRNRETEPEAGLGLMKLSMGRGEFTSVVERGQRLLESHPYFEDRSSIHYLMGQAFEATGEIEKALASYGETEKVSDLIRVLLNVRKKNPQAFIESYPAYQSRVQDSMEVGEALLEDGVHLEEARAIFKHLLVGKEQDRALKNLARAYMAVGLEGLARDFLSDLIKRGVRDDEVFRVYGTLVSKTGRSDDALKAMDKVRNKSGSDWRMIGMLNEDRGRLDVALKNYDEAIRLGDGEAYLVRAELHRRRGKPANAIPDFRKAAEFCKSDADRLWATYQAGVLSGDSTLIKSAADWGAGTVSQVAGALFADREFREKYGRNRALK